MGLLRLQPLNWPRTWALLVPGDQTNVGFSGTFVTRGAARAVVVGALALIGLPELLREFSEYRLLLYGALLIIMMLVRPQGLWPSAVLTSFPRIVGMIVRWKANISETIRHCNE